MTLTMRDLTVSYGARPAVDRVDLDVAEGEIVALVGESGCGKTSLARALLGLLPRNAVVTGSALLAGEELAGRRDWAGVRGKRIAIVPQGAMTGLSPVHRVGRQLTEMLTLHKGTATPADLLDRVGLPASMLKCYPHELSGGQRQRVAIALSLAGEPRLLVADEPTTGLDAISQRHVLSLLASLNISLLIVSHDLTGLLPHAHRIAVMYAGRLAEVTPSARLLHRQDKTHPYTNGLLTATPAPDRDVPWGSIPGQAPALDHTLTGCRFAPRCPLTTSRCVDEEPGLMPYGESHVACHRHDEDALPTYPTVPRADCAPQNIAVRATGLRHTFRSRARTTTALADVDLTIGAGEIHGLVGESGSGKSTLARVLLGLIRPAAGRVEIAGQELTAQRGKALRLLQQKIGFIHQDPYDSLHPGMRVGDLVAEPLAVSKTPAAERGDRVHRALRSAGLPDTPDFLRRHPGQLSGGQRQRVSIARALTGDPVLLIADEATSMLDVSTRAGIATTLRTLAAERGLAVLFVTHDLGEAIQSCDRITVLRHGTVVEHGTCADVAGSATDPYTRQLLQAAKG
ncbi:oligopeptide/dipeptide ABC transporter ATP-binding protein [Sinosporangium siamense]|uniref:ABC transporter ATP-binding protein n=1 Tax=Sinosporangium siamense TaxID=1367973 RepID=A0A919VB76_9ACTN|nr:ABC transporter ATP-binding protein [Sinosporangium siamense]GII91834.1 ABC transporter ATP-binding protein [Sinosporangium siamense]